MTTEKNRKLGKILSLVVIAAGCAVTAGWIFDIGLLKSISPVWISMKLSTAFTFLLSGISLYFIIRSQEGDIEKAFIALSITSLLIMLIMGTLFFSALLRVRTGVEDLFIKDAGNAALSVSPGRPSVPTMVCFVLIAAAGILTTLNPDKLRVKLRAIGLIICSIGAIAVAGYIINAPLVYYYIKDHNSAMACHTAVMFVLLGTGFICL
jgi:hypothetical protein